MPGRWFAGVAIYRKVGREMEVLVQESRSTDPKYSNHPPQTKFPGGTDDHYPEDGSVRHTARRETHSETGLVIKDMSKLVSIFTHEVSSTHYKEFFAVKFEDCEGTLRESPIRDGDDILSPPKWVSMKTVGRVLYRTHQPALLELIRMEPWL